MCQPEESKMKIKIHDRQERSGEDDCAAWTSLVPLARRAFLLGSAAAGATLLLPERVLAADGRKLFTILHTNDMHSAFIGMGPSADYDPSRLDTDSTRGGFARLASRIAQRKSVAEKFGPVLVLDAGDFLMGTPFGAATREVGGELRLMSRMGYDATTLGNHEFDLGPDGLGQSIKVASQAGRIPAVIASNCDFTAPGASLADLQSQVRDGLIRRHIVIERGGVRFGLFGVLGKEAVFYTGGAGEVKFTDAIEAAREMASHLRDNEKVDVVIALSHGGVEKDKDGRYTSGDDVRLAEQAPRVDVVIGGHSHTEVDEPIIVNGRTPVVQTGKEARNLGELVLALDGDALKIVSYRLYPIDAAVLGDREITEEIDHFKQEVTGAVFASRGYRIDQPLAVAPEDLPNTFTDIAASTPLANLVTDAFRNATKADIGFTANGMMRAGLKRGKSGVQTVYDVFAVAPLGAGVVDRTAGSALVTAYFTGLEVKNLLEFFLIENPVHPGEYFPRVSGMRFHYDPSRPKFDVVTDIELGDFDNGYRPIDISGKDERLYSLTCPLMFALIAIGVPKYTKGKLAFAPKNKRGEPLRDKVEALDAPRNETPYLLPPAHEAMDDSSVVTATGAPAGREVKEWQAIMDHMRALPADKPGELPVIAVDARAKEVRAIRRA
jgi:5'-nucleotidase